MCSHLASDLPCKRGQLTDQQAQQTEPAEVAEEEQDEEDEE